MVLYDVISPLWSDDISILYFLIIVPMGYILIGFDCVDRALVLVITGMVGVQIGCGGGTIGMVLSLPRID